MLHACKASHAYFARAAELSNRLVGLEQQCGQIEFWRVAETRGKRRAGTSEAGSPGVRRRTDSIEVGRQFGNHLASEKGKER